MMAAVTNSMCHQVVQVKDDKTEQEPKAHTFATLNSRRHRLLIIFGFSFSYSGDAKINGQSFAFVSFACVYVTDMQSYSHSINRWTEQIRVNMVGTRRTCLCDIAKYHHPHHIYYFINERRNEYRLWRDAGDAEAEKERERERMSRKYNFPFCNNCVPAICLSSMSMAVSFWHFGMSTENTRKLNKLKPPTSDSVNECSRRRTFLNLIPRPIHSRSILYDVRLGLGLGSTWSSFSAHVLHAPILISSAHLRPCFLFCCLHPFH